MKWNEKLGKKCYLLSCLHFYCRPQEAVNKRPLKLFFFAHDQSGWRPTNSNKRCNQSIDNMGWQLLCRPFLPCFVVTWPFRNISQRVDISHSYYFIFLVIAIEPTFPGL